MRFSIVTPTRNALPQLKRCIGSVRGQHGVGFEHIIQDACSNDGTPQWLALQDDLLSVSERDRGMYDAINRGWCRAQGQILSWLNSDEQYLPGTLKEVSDTFSMDPSLDFVYGHCIVVRPDGHPLAARREIGLSSSLITSGFLYAASCTMFFHRRLLDDGRLRLDESFRYAADMDLILRLLESRARWFQIDKYLSLFGYDGNNLSCSPEMTTETEAVRHRHSKVRSSILNRINKVQRILRKMARGCYLPAPVTYDFAVSPLPDYERHERRLLFSFYQTRRA